ncbi:MAG: acyloxyacyl hydrolase [Bacteroidota bacterium]|nr:acyloxyacyl hydrolase [Bacteroidota bacterium]
MKKFLFVILLFFFASLQAQISNLSYSLSMGEGYVLPTNDFLKGKNKDNKKITNITHFSFKLTKQVDYSKPWHYWYKDFRYGLGAYHGVFNYSDRLNNPYAVYVFAGFSPYKYKKFTLKNELALGLSGVWEHYSKTNRQNIAISLPIEAYVHWQMEADWQVNNSWQAGLGLSFVHFSNGALVKPNKGINIISPTINFAYSPKPIERYNFEFKEKFNKHYYIDVNNWLGVHAVNFDYSKENGTRDTVQNSYWVYGQQWKFMMDVNPKYELGFGFEYLYNHAAWKSDTTHYKTHSYEELDNSDKFNVGIFLSFHYNVNNFSVLIEPGYALRQKYGYAPKFYQRLGLRHYAYKGWFSQIALRAYNYHVADFIEWGIGYRFGRFKRLENLPQTL